MYGSSLRIETWRPRALSSRPMLAAVMPLPREEVTPPVTKTYFAMGRGPPGVFPMLSKRCPGGKALDARGGLHEVDHVRVDSELFVVDEHDGNDLFRGIHREDRPVAGLAARQAEHLVHR